LAIGETTLDGLTYAHNGLYLYDILQDSLPHYEIGHIFSQTVRYTEDGMGFYVKADSLHSNQVFYSYEVDSPPMGAIEFNTETGRFKYYPAAEDYKPFTVTFYATSGGKSVFEEVKFSLMPQTVSEVYAFQTQGVMPSATDYTLVAETSDTKHLNNEARTAYSFSISGKDIVFDDGLQNKVLGLNGRNDVYELNIFAERLTIRSALAFPQTNVTIYAKELVFEDHDTVMASINTTPVPIGILGDEGIGADGADAGNITLYVGDIRGNMAKRFILNGARGQNVNRNGTPGNGGNGGTITSTIDIRDYCDFVRGSCGVRYDVAPGGSTEKGPVISSGRAGRDGCFELVRAPYAYLHPYYIAAVIRHANDAFINNYADYAQQVCTEYRNLVEAYMTTEEWEACDEEEAMALQSTLSEMNDMLYRLEQGLDYFGNPVGWVPLLSFEVMLENYNNEIDRAVPTLYMYYWLNHIDETLQHKIAASEFAANMTEKEIKENEENINSLTLEIPVIEDQIAEVVAMKKDIEQQINALQEKLLAKAKHNVKKKNRIKKAVSICTSVMNCVPVYGSAMNTFSNIAFASDIIGEYVGLGEYTSVFDNLGSVDYDALLKKIKEVKDTISWNKLGKDDKYLKNSWESVYKKSIAPLESSIRNISKQVSTSSTPIGEVEKELNRLEAESAEWQALNAELKRLIQKEADLNLKLTQISSNILKAASELGENIVRLDGLRRDVFEGNSKRDLNAMQYLEKMEQQAKYRLQKYHYYLRKAYEYRLLKPYVGEFNLVGMYERFEEFVKKGSDVELTKEQYTSLSATFKEVLSKVSDDVISGYTANHKEHSAPITIVIPKEQIDMINMEEGVTLNFYEMGVFSPDEENIRIVDLGIQHIETHIVGEVGYSGYMDLNMTHSGISKFRKDGQIYWFDHMSRTSTSPHNWGLRYDAVSRDSKPIQPSAASASLLSAILEEGKEGNIMMFSRPSAWSDLTLSKKVHTSGGADIVVDSLVLRLQYDFTLRPSGIRNIDITANEGLLSYIASTDKDLNGRSGGNGTLSRSYGESSQSLSFTATQQYGRYHFVNWTDRAGRVVSDKMELTVNRSKDQFYRANYERRVPILSVPDTIMVSHKGGTYSVNVKNIGSGDLEMDWYVSDSLSSWVHLTDAAEGIDEGVFSFAFDANESKENRMDSLEIFAPETDVMSKVIYIAQVDDSLLGIESAASQSAIRVFPNPAKDFVNVEGEGLTSVRVCTLTGKEVSVHYANESDMITVDLNGIPTGVYLLAVKDGSGLTFKKILKTR